MKITVLGASGFVGRHLVAAFAADGIQWLAPGRHDPAIFEQSLGHVVYCSGVTAGFREHPLDAIEAHVCYLWNILRNAEFESLLYLSSTRVYSRSTDTTEDAVLQVAPLDHEDIFNISKLAGEAACLTSGRNNVRIARLSNVYGPGMSPAFLSYVLREAATCGKVVLRTTLDSAKDYVSIDDVVQVLPRIALHGRHRIYNVASGINTSNREIAGLLARYIGCEVEVAANARTILFPTITTDRIRNEFGFRAHSLTADFTRLVGDYVQTGETSSGPSGKIQ